jgi:hypothetical protein
MSLAAFCERDSITIKRLSTTRGTAGGKSQLFTTAARGSLPTSSNCWLTELTEGAQMRELGVRSERSVWKILTTSDPKITVADHVEFDDADGVSHEARVTNPSMNVAGLGRVYRTIVEEVGNEA